MIFQSLLSSLIPKLFNVKTIILVVFVLIVWFLSFSNEKLRLENENLTLKVIERQSEINKLKSILEEQNKAILDLKLSLDSVNKNQKIIEKIKEVKIKDNTCESELKSYKELFKLTSEVKDD